MKILLVSATEMETRLFRESYVKHRDPDYRHAGIRFLTTGVGMVATAARLASAVCKGHSAPLPSVAADATVPDELNGGMKAPAIQDAAHTPGPPYDLIIQAGIAGSFDRNLPLGNVYRVSHEQIADMGVMEGGQWKDVFDMGLEDANAAPYQHRRLPATPFDHPALATIPAVTAVTVNEISTNDSRIQTIINKYQPALESMEGAAFHFVALESGVPFLQLRGVSNYVGERNKSNWKMKEAIVNLNECLSGIIAKIAID